MRSSVPILLAIVLALPAVTPSLSIQQATGGGHYTYVFTVRESGWIDIVTKFNSTSAGSSWVLVPKFREYNFKVLSGSISEKKLIRNTSYYFYSNLTFSYIAGTSLEISWSYRFGALIVEPNGAFFSTQIAFSPEDDATVLVKLPKKFHPQGIEPKGYRLQEGGDYNVVRYDVDGSTNNTMRVLISFKVKDGQKFKKREIGKLTVSYPPRYEDVVENITKYYRATLPLIEDYTSVKEEIPVRVKLFVPGTMEEITTLGYTGPRFTSDVITQGEINLNMMLVRMPDYELPDTFVHELLHQYMQAAGLSVDLRWAHEGLAQYLSSVIVKEALGFDVPYDEVAERAVLTQTGGNFAFLLEWRGGGLPGNPGLYYTASEVLIRKLAEKYGGPELYKKFFRLVRRDRVVVKDPGEFVRYLSEAAGQDISDYLRSFGIKVEALDRTTLALISTARDYARATSWFDPFSEDALLILNRSRTREAALQAIAMVVLGLVSEALAAALVVSAIAVLLVRRKGGEHDGRVEEVDKGDHGEKEAEGEERNLRTPSLTSLGGGGSSTSP